jgi:hypothetical protein
MAYGGKLLVYGQLDNDPISFPSGLLVVKLLTIQVCPMYSAPCSSTSFQLRVMYKHGVPMADDRGIPIVHASYQLYAYHVIILTGILAIGLVQVSAGRRKASCFRGDVQALRNQEA